MESPAKLRHDPQCALCFCRGNHCLQFPYFILIYRGMTCIALYFVLRVRKSARRLVFRCNCIGGVDVGHPIPDVATAGPS
jgi:hypothetical protein